jgi:hypothetical protein
MTTRVAEQLRDLAAWADYSARLLETAARCPNDDVDSTRRTVSFPDAVALDGVLTGFRKLPQIIEDIAEQVERRPALSVIAGGKR